MLKRNKNEFFCVWFLFLQLLKVHPQITECPGVLYSETLVMEIIFFSGAISFLHFENDKNMLTKWCYWQKQMQKSSIYNVNEHPDQFKLRIHR